ncbi:MAG: hypothetical protein IJI36_03300 [Kiritimatiellae bacterium]|nr:hypothetical protein [Kiritimatiellia bacterium]
MSIGRIAACAVGIVCAGFCRAAVEPGENIVLNGALEADQASMPPFWNVSKPEKVSWRPSGGPDGKPYMSISSDERDPAEATIRQYGLRLVEGGKYRISAYVRTTALSMGYSGVSVVNQGWYKGASAGKLPPDTAGKWVKIEHDFTCFASKDGTYSVVAFLTKFKGTFDVADIRLVALDEAALDKTERSPIFAIQSKPRLIPFDPILGKIPLYDPTVEFRFFGYLPKGTAENDFEAVLEVEGASCASRVPLAVKGGLRLAVPGAISPTQGVFAVSIERKSSGERIFTERHRYALRDVPRELKKGRRLNNLTSELVCGKHAGVGTETFSFDVFRDSWLFIASPRGATVRFDGREVVSPDTPRGETFRLTAAGRHEIAVSGPAGDVVVRMIADIFNYCPGANSYVQENRPYDWAFQEKYVLPAVTTQNGGSVPKEHLQGFHARGYRWLANLGTIGVSAEELVRRLNGAAGMNKEGYSGVTCDEQFLHNPGSIVDYTSGLKAYELSASPTRAIFTWIVGKPFNRVIDEEFFAASVNASLGEGKVLFEAYCRTKETEGEARSYLDNYVKDTLVRFCTTYPLAIGSTCIAFGNFNQLPILSLAHHPEVDFKYYLDLQVNMAANDPAFEGLGSIGYWGSYYADEELHRWSFALMRHYAVEGRKDMLSAKYGFTYRPDHVLNGDFRGTLAPWTTNGAVRADSFAGFAKASQNRWGGNGGVGDTFAVLSRGKDSFATVSQKAKGLVPGRKYRLRYSTFDVKDVKARRLAPRTFAISASAGAGAAVDDTLTWTHVDRRVKGRYAANNGCARVNFSQIVFTATAPETEIAFSNEQALEGEELGLNYVSLLPYYPAD